jgi:glycosyltransferase involved in cell wall biosynthesis
MRILCVAAWYPPNGKGGGPKGAETIAKALYSRGHIVRVITMADREECEVRNGIQVKTIRTLNVYYNYWIKQPTIGKVLWHAIENFNPRALLRMRGEIAKFRPDIVVTISIENTNVATWIAAWISGCPSVHVIQSYFLMCWRGSMFSKDKNCKRPCLQCRAVSIGKKICSQIVDGVIAEASHSLSLHCKHGFFRRANARIIPGAVSGPIPSPPPPSTKTSAIRVGFIGMLTPNKGIGTLGEAAALLGEEAPFEYLIAGDGEPQFVQKILSSFPTSKIRYLGWVSSNSFYPLIDVLVVPSIWAEPFGYVCIEALSFGVPVVVARSGALPEIIEHEISGLVFEAADHKALAVCLGKIASDRRLLRRLQHGALARAKQYSPQALAASLDTFLRQVHSSSEKKNAFGARLRQLL